MYFIKPKKFNVCRQIKKGEPLTDKLVREYAPRLRFLPRAPSPPALASVDDR